MAKKLEISHASQISFLSYLITTSSLCNHYGTYIFTIYEDSYCGSLYWTFFIQIKISLLWNHLCVRAMKLQSLQFSFKNEIWCSCVKFAYFYNHAWNCAIPKKICLFLNSIETFSPKKCIEWPQAKSGRSILVKK